MTRKPVHEIVFSKKDLAALKRAPGPLMTPLSAEQLERHQEKLRQEMAQIVSGEAPKARRDMKNIEHRAQRRLYEIEIPAAQTRYPLLADKLGAVYAIPNFNANLAGAKAKIIGARFKAEGQKAGSPDNHVPVPQHITSPNGYTRLFGSLYLELKAETYPNAAQRERFPQLAACGNAVVTIRMADEYALAANALDIIVFYLQGRPDFYHMGHPSHTYVHNTIHPLSFYLKEDRP